MKVYLSAAWHRRSEIRILAERLKWLGFEITSRWLSEDQRGETDAAYMDFEDVLRCDVLIRFSDKEFVNAESDTVPRRLLSGGRLVEQGMALAAGKRVVVVGGRQPVFDALPFVSHVADETELIRFLRLLEPCKLIAPYEPSRTLQCGAV